jgi:hypothetical protein
MWRIASSFLKALFGGSLFIRWTLTPILLILILGLPFAFMQTGRHPLTFVVTEAFLVLFLLSLYGERFTLIRRVTTGAIFLMFLWYCYDTVIMQKLLVAPAKNLGGSSPWSALLGLLVIGLPSLAYTVFGRFTWVPPQPDSDIAEEDKVGERSAEGRTGTPQ